MFRQHIRLSLWTLFAVWVALSSMAVAQEGKSGLSANRLKLPKGPGSIEGVGEDAEVDINMGLVSYKVPFAVPSGYEGMSPSFALSYATSSGNGPVGIGWSLSGSAKIERQTSKGLPQYTGEDGIVAFGGTELVLVEEVPDAGSDAVTRKYRARYEGGFALYTWVDEEGDGRGGYWIVQSPDGKVSYFGANRLGEIVQDARLEAQWMQGAEEQGGTFCWELVEQVDLLGHRIVYGYEQHGGRPYLSQVQWVMREDGSSRYRASFAYEERRDPVDIANNEQGEPLHDNLSDGKPGVEVRWEKRLSEVNVTVRPLGQGAQRLRSYRLLYEPMEQSGGISRLIRVQQYGMDEAEGAYPIDFHFSYTGTFDPVCNQEAGGMGEELCSAPQVHQVGSVGVDFATRRADLIDINGDNLPDVIDTTEGTHRLFIQTVDMAGNGDAQAQMMQGGRFLPPRISQNALNAFQLTLAQVHMVDLDGNGRSDMVDGNNEAVLFNDGRSDWQAPVQIAGMRLPALHQDPNARFFDVNGDHRIDVVSISEGGAFWYENQGHWHDENGPAEGRGFKAQGQQLRGVPDNLGFVQSGLQLADMNGDGLLDLVAPPREGTVQYWMNLGWGRFVGQDPQNPALANEMGVEIQDGQGWNLVDLNGDGLTDLVRVASIDLEYALNRGAERFSPITRLVGSTPERDESVSIRFADMNGSGSTDIVYVDGSGMVQYVELFARRPNLLSRVENGIGKVIELTYGTSIEHMARDGGPEAWRYRLPQPMLVLDKVVSYDTLSEVKQIQEYHYKHGFYDGKEQQFRGFEYVEVFTHGDDSMEPGKGIYHYEVGAQDPYRKGLLLEHEMFSNNEPLSLSQSTYEDCPIEGVPAQGQQGVDALPFPIRFVCSTRNETILKERRPENEWVTLRTEQSYDGYGNTILSTNHGVVTVGGEACGACPAGWDNDSNRGEPCGQLCLGDEMYERTWFIEPSDESTQDKWVVKVPYKKQSFGVPGSEFYTETRMYYDGEDFVGLELGRLTQGLVKRTTQKKLADSDEVIPTKRYALDEHGNVTTTMDANDHRRSFTYDDEGVLLTSEQMHFDDPTVREDNSVYGLRKTVTHHPTLETVLSSTAWQRVQGEALVSEPRHTEYSYDTFGRIAAIAKPGDTLNAPSQVFEYELGDPISRIITKERTEANGPLHLETIQCFDGLGRKYQERERETDQTFQTDGFIYFNVQGDDHKFYQPYISEGAHCDLEPPVNVLFEEIFFDASSRPISSQLPDGNIYGEASQTHTVYGPLWVQFFDTEDTDRLSPNFGTNETSYTNGLDSTIRIERQISINDPAIAIDFYYDGLGRITKQKDDAGNAKAQSYDLLDRVIIIEDPNSNQTIFEHDDTGNIILEQDAEGTTTLQSFDESNRKTKRWNQENPEETLTIWEYDRLFDDNCNIEKCSHLEGKLAKVRYPLLRGLTNFTYYGYDNRNQTTFSKIIRRGYTFDFENSYDNAGRVIANQYPGNIEIEYNYDNASRVISIPGFIEEIIYDTRGLVEQYTYASNIETQYQYDSRMRLERLVTRSVNSLETPLLAYQYIRSRENNIIRIEDELAELSPTIQPSAQAEYQFDSLYRLTQAALDIGRNTEETIEYQYNSIDNLISKTSSLGNKSRAHLGALKYGQRGAGPHAVSQISDYLFHYNENGQMVFQGDGGINNSNQPFEGLHHQWDYRGRISQTLKHDESIVEYAYNDNGERTVKFEKGQRTDYLTNNTELRDGILSIYIALGNQNIARIETAALTDQLLPDLSPAVLRQQDEINTQIQINPDGAIKSSDAWVLFAYREGIFSIHDEAQTSKEVDEISQLLNAATHRLLLNTEQEQKTFFHQNHLGSSTISTDEEGQKLQHSLHYPYGQLRYQSAHLPKYSYAGKETDISTGLSYHSARYLHPFSGRWLSPDPHFIHLNETTYEKPWESINPYAYGTNNPINNIDPNGNFAIAIPIILGGGTIIEGIAVVGSAILIGLGIDHVINKLTQPKPPEPITQPKKKIKPIPESIRKSPPTSKGSDRGIRRDLPQAKPDPKKVERLCFTGGTLISTSKGFVPIEQIRKNNMVLSFDHQTLQTNENRVIDHFKRTAAKTLILTFAQKNGHSLETIETTAEHPFWNTKIGWVQASKLHLGDQVYSYNGDEYILRNIEHSYEPKTVYNFKVERDHNYFVGKTRLLTHNPETGCQNPNKRNREPVKRGPKGGKQHTPGKNHRKPSHKKNEHNNQRKRVDNRKKKDQAEREQAERDWEKMSPDAQKLLPDRNPANYQ